MVLQQLVDATIMVDERDGHGKCMRRFRRRFKNERSAVYSDLYWELKYPILDFMKNSLNKFPKVAQMRN